MSVTLITGASSGLGAEMARQLAAEGEDLALCARRTDRLEALRAEITAAHPGRRVEVRALDVNDEEQVFEVFRAFAADFGHLDRIVLNAGIGKGAPIGTGMQHTNRQTAMTNFVAALTQTEAAMEILRAQNAGQLVMVSSMSAMRGMPRATATYAATKIAVARLVEGLRVELHGSPIRFTVLYPGYINSEMNPEGTKAPFIVGTEKGVAAMVEAIRKQKASAYVPAWPWAVLGPVMKVLPVPLLRKMV